MKRILITGDVYLGSPHVENLAENEEFEKLFGDFLPLIRESDLSATNLESPITEKGTRIPKAGPHLKASNKSLKVLKLAGFDLLTLANNHILDYGRAGLDSTFEECKKLQMPYVGAGYSLEEARKPFEAKLGDKSVAIINIAENEFSNVGINTYGANPLDLIDNSHDIRKAKEIFDKVIVIVHGGREYYNLPSPNFRKTLRFFADCGADAVVGHHTHCVSGYEIYKDVPIFYGLGNFLFNSPKSSKRTQWNTGMAIILMLKNDNGLDFEVVPYLQCENYDDPSVRLLNEKEKGEFLKHLDELNEIIKNDSQLKQHWSNYIESQSEQYKNNLFVNNKWFRKFVGRKIVPLSMLTNEEHTVHTLNLIKCEAHREILLDSLERDIAKL